MDFAFWLQKNPRLNKFPLVGSVPARRRYCPCTYHSTSAGVSTCVVLKPRSPEQSTSCTRRTLHFQMTEILKNTCVTVTLSTFTPSAHHMHGGTIFLFNSLHSFPQRSPTCAVPKADLSQRWTSCCLSLQPQLYKRWRQLCSLPNLLLSCGLWSSPDTLVKCYIKFDFFVCFGCSGT